jgi:two-component system phosphate regulon sensor histidine kinase PhoR
MWAVELRWVVVFLALYTAAVFFLGRWHARRSGFRFPLDPAPLGVLRLSPDLRYTEANPAARQILGLNAPQGRLPEAGWRALLEEDLRAARATGVGRSRLVSLAGERALRWWVVPEPSGAWLFVIEDRGAYSGFQSMRRLLAGLAHELRTPLATLLTHLQVLQLPAVAPEIRSQSLRILEEETRWMIRMVHAVLDLGQLSSGEPLALRPLSIATVAEAAVAEKLPEAQARQQSLSLEIEEELPEVWGDADRLKQVFLNLLDNAIRYSRPGDRIAVILRPVPEGVQCEVIDTGPGIPPEHLPYITEPFYRGEAPEATGAGLGLAIVAEILRHHQAHLEIESRTEGETGTCVRFVLPATKAV